MNSRVSPRRVPFMALALLATAPLLAQFAPIAVDRGGNGLGLNLRRLGVTGRVLYVTAHPDDEHNGVLVRLSRGLGIRSALLTLTRGEGGQNAIGPERDEALGVLRTEEILAVHRYDGVEQYFARAYEFGFSFDAGETLARWGREETLGDVVRVVRTFRPDLMLIMPLEGRAHQHHLTSAELAREAFRVAADPRRFPEQIQAGLRPWQTAKLYQGGVGGGPAAGRGTPVRLGIAALDPLLGMSAQQFGALARANHRSQGSRQMAPDPGTGEGTFLLVDSEPKVEGAEASILDGLDLTPGGLLRFAQAEGAQVAFLAPGLAAITERFGEARAAYDARSPEKAVAPLAQALLAVRKTWDEVAQSRLSEAAREELLSRLDDQERETSKALALAQGLTLEARVDDGRVVPGQTLGLTLSLWNQGATAVTVDEARVDVPVGWSAERKEGEIRSLEPGQSLRLRFAVTTAPAARPTEPYWKRDPKKDRYALDSPGAEGLPWNPPHVTASARLRAAGAALRLDAPAIFRYEAAEGGEKQHVLAVVPALSVSLTPEIVVFPTGVSRAAQEVRVQVTNHAPTEVAATVRLEAPAGWPVEPKEASVRLEREGDEGTVRFTVTSTAGLGATSAPLRAVATHAGLEYRSSVQEIAYPHIQSRQRLVAAEARLLALDVRTAPGVRVGYVMGTGDLVASAIEALGVPLTLLSADDLAFSDLGRFSTIVIGVRAYETRRDLRAQHPRLLKWVEAGGHLLVQYHRAAFNSRQLPQGVPNNSSEPRGVARGLLENSRQLPQGVPNNSSEPRGVARGLLENSRQLPQGVPNENSPPPPPPAVADSPYAPWPASVTSRRITDETAKLEPLVPASAVFNTPNRIGESDWADWVQERAIQLLDTRDPRYLELLAGADPFPNNPGVQKGILVETRVGKGTWTYTGLVLFRQLPAGNPGAYRLLANLLSRPRPR